VVTIVISLLTRPREDNQLAGLVYSLTEKPSEKHLPWYKRPAALAVIIIVVLVLLNVFFG
jgi:SSS family solute:Na+ symporter